VSAEGLEQQQVSGITVAGGVLSLPRRDRIAILSALAGVTTLSWIYLVAGAAAMDSMSKLSSVPQNMLGEAMTRFQPWTAFDALLMFLMWAVMMVGMMVPSAAPMTLIYAAVARKAAREGSTLAPTAVFISGYIVMWTLFSAGATLAQWGLEGSALLSPMMATTSPLLGAGLLIFAGLYQLTPVKDVCLRSCRSPVRFLSEHWRPGTRGAFTMGLEHGAFCLGCCWVLMGLLFYGGVMNLWWIAGLAIYVLIEKLAPLGARLGRYTGGLLILWGVGVLVGSAGG